MGFKISHASISMYSLNFMCLLEILMVTLNDDLFTTGLQNLFVSVGISFFDCFMCQFIDTATATICVAAPQDYCLYVYKKLIL